jgi:serine/threonine-protein kinase
MARKNTTGGGTRRMVGGSSGLKPGDVLDDRYRIEALLGEGGMGSVFVARHVHIGRQVAVKVLHQERYSKDDRERFRREAAIAVQLRSPHVVEVLDFGEDPRGYAYYAMELLEGESLRTLLERERRLAPERAVRLLRQLLTGLVAAHHAGVVHRDLKPENLWLLGAGADQRLKILDFGIAKFLQPGASLDQTAVGMVVGTPEYLAPEQATGGAVDGRADLYAAGILAFVMLTGRHPFDTSDVKALSRAHAFQKVPSPTTVLPELAAWPRLLQFVARATEKDREERAQSAEELLKLLEGAEHAEHLATSTGESAPVRKSITGGAVLVGKAPASNATLLLARVDGWDEQAPEADVERARILAEHDAVTLPAINAFEGRRLRSSDDALLLAFVSPTDAIHCAAALHDRLAATPVAFGGGKLQLRIGVHLAEVRFGGGELSGPWLEALRKVQGAAAPGEVWLSRPVYLTMSRSEVAVEAMGDAPLDGLPEPSTLYRVVREPGELPYGGRHQARVQGALGSYGLLAPFLSGLASIETAGANEGRLRAAFRVSLAALSIGLLWLLWALAWLAEALVSLVTWIGWAKRPVPRTLERSKEGLAWSRARLSERTTLRHLAMHRPGRIPTGTTGPVETVEIVEDLELDEPPKDEGPRKNDGSPENDGR